MTPLEKAERAKERMRLGALKADDVGFFKVYEGGHHEVWCNGMEHRTRGGGYAGINKSRIVTAQRGCDCDYWKALNDTIGKS